MAADDHAFGIDLVGIGCDRYPFFRKGGNNLGIMDKRPERLRVLRAFRLFERKIQSALDAIAGARAFSQDHFHANTYSPSWDTGGQMGCSANTWE